MSHKQAKRDRKLYPWLKKNQRPLRQEELKKELVEEAKPALLPQIQISREVANALLGGLLMSRYSRRRS